MDEIEIYLTGDIDIKDGIVIDGFPSVGLVSTIAANYLITQLKMKRVGAAVSKYFPVASIIHETQPSHPLRIYAKDKLIVFISEFQTPTPLVLPLAREMLNWSKENGVKMIISPEGVVCQKTGEDEACGIYGIGTTEEMNDLLKEKRVDILQNGIITGMSGMLLNEGERRGSNVLCILGDANPNYPDARAAAKLVETIDKLVPELEIDTGPLLKEAGKFENVMKETMSQVQPILQKHEQPFSEIPPRSMYG